MLAALLGGMLAGWQAGWLAGTLRYFECSRKFYFLMFVFGLSADIPRIFVHRIGVWEAEIPEEYLHRVGELCILKRCQGGTWISGESVQTFPRKTSAQS